MVDNAKNVHVARDTSVLRKFGISGAQQNATYNLSNERKEPKINRDSCCLPCSCESTCAEIGNCCDKCDIIGNMCHYPFVQHGNLEDDDTLGI